MSRHGQAILERMLERIRAWESGGSLRGLIDDLGAMYESLDPVEQPPEREWMDSFVPLDRVADEPAGHDADLIRRRVVEHLRKLESLLERARGASELNRAGR